MRANLEGQLTPRRLYQLLGTGAGIEVSPYLLEFPERTVMLARGSRAQFGQSGLLLNAVSDQFRARINAQAVAEEGTEERVKDPNRLLVPQFRHKGSIHKDVWRGPAVDLAARGQIAVCPAMGWWRTRTKLERFKREARYALVMSISVPEVEVDLYTEVASRIPVAAEAEVLV